MYLIALAFLGSIAFEIFSQMYNQQNVDDASTGQRRDTDVGFQRYHDETELDVGLGLVKSPDQVLNNGDSVDLTKPSDDIPKINVLYCIG